MNGRQLHPSVQQFKEFVKRHPKLVEEVRGGNKSWQEFYEDWYLFGEEDEMWKKYRQNIPKKENNHDAKSEFMSTFFSSLKNIDMNQMQQHIENVNNVIATIQNMIQQLQNGNGGTSQLKQNGASHPFSFRKD